MFQLYCLRDDEEDIFRSDIDVTNQMSHWEFSFGQLKEERQMTLDRWQMILHSRQMKLGGGK
jgi:hypothetical protein